MAYAVKLDQYSARVINTQNGQPARTISGKFTSAVVQGDEVHLTLPDGRVKVVNIRTGQTIRTI